MVRGAGSERMGKFLICQYRRQFPFLGGFGVAGFARAPCHREFVINRPDLVGYGLFHSENRVILILLLVYH